LAEAVRKAGKTQLAAAVGVHLTTLNALLDDSWSRIERDTIERLLDHLDLRDIADLLGVSASGFWNPFADSGTYFVFRGVVEESVLGKKVKVPLEEDAKALITTFFRTRFPDIQGGFAQDALSPRAILEYARSKNVISVGAHPANKASEVLVCDLFGAKPFDPSPENRARIPFQLIRPSSGRSAFTSSDDLVSPKRALGVYSTSERRMVAEVDWWPTAAFMESTIKQARDAGFVVVANRRNDLGKPVKLIVVAGIGRIGTQAAVQAIIRDFRDLEPTHEETMTVGVLEALYRKPARGDNRQLTSFRWVLRQGGRRPIA